MSEKKQITRQDFLKGMGMTVAGVAVTGSLAGVLTACSSPEPAATETASAVEWPYEYKKLDVATVQDRAYKGYFEKGG